MDSPNLTAPPSAARAVDWRFLLPSPATGAFQHLLLLGGSDADTRAALELGVARYVSTTVPRYRDVDAIILLSGAAEPPETAFRCLAPEGVVYWEIDRRRARNVALTPARAMRRLARAGITASRAYWVKPGFPDRDMYLPLSAPGALRWYLDTLYRRPSVSRRMLGIALRALARGGRGFSSIAPCYAVTAARGRTLRPSVVEAARQHAGEPAETGDSVFLAQGRAEWSRLAVMVFDRGAPSPRAVLKCARRPAFNPQVESEHRFLVQVGARLPPLLRTSLPASSLFQWNNLAISRQTCVTGASLSTRTGADDARAHEDFLDAARWLADFHSATTIARVPAQPWLARHLVEGLCREYAATFGTNAAERRLFDAVAASLDTVAAAAMPIVWQHTDFGPWNVYRGDQRISVIDWEVTRPGPPLVDLLYFATHWAVEANHLATGDARRRYFAAVFCDGDSGDSRAAAIRDGARSYMRRLDIAHTLVPFLLVYTFVEQALERAHRFGALRRPAPDHSSNQYLSYLRTISERSETLFPFEVPHAA